jgi:prepilin-type N-terminal cleavage/methylation domain-containing protein
MLIEKCKDTNFYKKGFTLIELAIVIIVMGFLIAGIVGGQSLIESTKRQGIITDIEKYKTALLAFKLEYDALPGDFQEATEYWGEIDDSSGTNCSTVSGDDTQTCDGNGDGKIEYVKGGAYLRHESWRAWQHLSNAGIIKGSYTGISGTECTDVSMCTLPGINAPESTFDGASWHLFYVNSSGGWAGKNKSRNILALGNPNRTTDLYKGRWIGKALTAKTMKYIDEKIDDGRPFRGELVNMSGTSPNSASKCADNSSNNYSTPNASYDITRDTYECIMFVDMNN